MTLGEWARRLHGELQGASPDQAVAGFSFDQREDVTGRLYIAVRGERADGHDFALEAIQKGAVAALVERPIDGPHVLVTNVVEALAELGRSFRAEFSGPVVGITGSNGKTSAKEFTAAAMGSLGNVLKNEGNQNTELTSPLVWTRLTEQTRVAVIEMGMRGPGQIAHLAKISQPTTGLVTMIGTAHLEKVGTREGIARAKSELLQALPANGHAVIWAEDDYFDLLSGAAPCPVATFGFSPDAHNRIEGCRALDWRSTLVRGRLNGEAWETTIPALGRHQALNAAAAILVAALNGVPIEAAAAGCAHAEIPAMRMEIIERQGVTIVLDTYNASPDSTVAALQTLAEQPVEGRRVVVLGEMKELGDYSESGHRSVGRALAKLLPDEALLYGETVRWIAEDAIAAGYPAAQISTALTLDDIAAFVLALQPGDAVLIKGSRALGMEKALDALEPASR